MSKFGSISFAGDTDEFGDPDIVYYNGSIINNKVAIDTGADPIVRFIETRDIPLVKDCSKYQFSIVRFVMNGPGKDLPLFIPLIRTGVDNPTNDINLTIYSCSMDLAVRYVVGGITYEEEFTTTQPIIWEPEYQDLAIAPIPAPSTCQTGQDISTRYYWSTTYTHMMSLVNKALRQCVIGTVPGLLGLQAQFNAWWLATIPSPGIPPTLGTKPPQLTYNPTSNLFSIYAPTYSFGFENRTSAGTNADEFAQLYFGENLYGLFGNFKSFYRNESNRRTVEIYIEDILNGANTVSYGGVEYFLTQQDYESTSTLWSPIESIVFTSGLLPVVNEATSDPIRFGDNNDTVLQNSISAFQPIITDVAVFQNSASGYRGFVEYAPTAEYRMASMSRSKTAINSIDIQVFWKNRLTGELVPVQMWNGSSVSLKIMLRKSCTNVRAV
jgi:hypothetical protein